jgi:hypothetical protein
MALEGLRRLFEKQDSTAELRRAHEQQLTELYVEIGKLTTQVSWLKKVTTLTRQERVALIERAEGELPLRLQADLLSLSRSSLFTGHSYRQLKKCGSNIALMKCTRSLPYTAPARLRHSYIAWHIIPLRLHVHYFISKEP